MCKSSRSHFIFSYILLILWGLLIFLLSSEGHDASSGRSDIISHALASWGAAGGQADSLTVFVRKSAHSLLYFVFGLLAFNVVRLHAKTLWKTAVVAWGIVIMYAMSDELHQYFVPGRSPELCDVLIDSTAGLVAVLLCVVATQLAIKRRQNNH